MGDGRITNATFSRWVVIMTHSESWWKLNQRETMAAGRGLPQGGTLGQTHSSRKPGRWPVPAWWPKENDDFIRFHSQNESRGWRPWENIWRSGKMEAINGWCKNLIKKFPPLNVLLTLWTCCDQQNFLQKHSMVLLSEPGMPAQWNCHNCQGATKEQCRC